MARNGQGARLLHRVRASVASLFCTVARLAGLCRLARACGAAALVGSADLLAATLPAAAQDATWLSNPTVAGPVAGTFDFDSVANWNPSAVPTGTATFGATSGPNLSFSAETTIGGWTFNAGASNYTFFVTFVTGGQTLAFNDAGIVINGGSATIANFSTINFYNSSTAGSATVNNSGGINFNDSSTAGSATVNNSGGINFNNTSTAGSAAITNYDTLNFNNSSTAGSATIINDFPYLLIANIYFYNSSTAGSATITNDDGSIYFENTSTAGSATITNDDGGIRFLNTSTAGSAAITNNGGSIYFENTSTAGSAAITNNGGFAVVDFSSSSGPSGDGKLSAGSIAGAGNFYLGSDQLTVGGNNLSTIVSGVISDCGASGTACLNSGASGGSLVKIGTGTLTLTGTDIYTGTTTINGGTLEVDGSIADTSSVTVNAGGTLSGTGTVDPPTTTIMSGGTLAPGNPSSPTGTLTINGNLVFQSAAKYLIAITGTNNSNTSVSGGTATLGGATIQIASGSTVVLSNKYTILTASSGVVGTFNPTVIYDGEAGRLSYDANDVYLTFIALNNLVSLLPPGAPTNVINVVNGIDNFSNSGGTPPPGFLNLFNLSPSQLVAALTQLDGEAATDAQKGAFALMNEFLGLMLDPFVEGRFAPGGQAIGFAPEREESFPPDIALAYAGVLKAPAKQNPDGRWTAWGSAFGGSSTTGGNAAVGSNNVRVGNFGFAAGMDYHYSRDTAFGFALAGAGTNWGLAQGLGGGRSDAFQVGVYGKSYFGPAYVAAALAFTNNWFTTNRIALGDQLTARFQGQSYGGRLEAGYRYTLPLDGSILGFAPYGAVQTQWFFTPTYSETDLTAGGFGLTYNAMTANDTRSELGARFDDPTLLGAMPLILRARLAWAHDWVSNPALNAVFEALPGTSFVVNGATLPENSALTSLGAQFYFTPALSFLAKFDGEFARGAQTYAGTGTLRYAW